MKNNIVIEDCKLIISSRTNIEFPKHIFVTGASGMLGLYSIEFFLALRNLIGKKLQIYINTRFPNIYLQDLMKQNANIIFNLDKSNFYNKMLLCENDKILIHSASPSNLLSIKNEPESLITTNILQVIDYSNIFVKSGGKFIFFSSGEIFGNNPPIPTSENDFTSFNHLELSGVYAESKKTAELILYLKSISEKFNFTIFRIFHTFGPGINLNDQRIFGTLLRSLYLKQPIVLRSDGSARRTLMYSGDLLQAILITQKLKDNLVFNISGDKEYTILEIANIVSNLVNPKLEVKFNLTKVDSNSNNFIKRGLANTDKLKTLGWEPLFNIEDAFFRTLHSCIDRSKYYNVD